MQVNSSNISGTQCSMTKRPQFSQPGILTQAEILGAPSRPLRWLLPSTPTRLRPLLQASSSSHRNARLHLPSQQGAPPSLASIGDMHRLLSHAPPPTQCLLFVRFIILAQLTDVRIQAAPRLGTISQSLPVVRPRTPIAATAVMTVMTTLPPANNVQIYVDLLSPPDLPPQNPRVNAPWMWPSIPTRDPLFPQAGRVPLRQAS